MLRINAFGCMSVVSDAGELSGAANQPRRLAILAMLARAGDRGIRREKILGVLWTDVEEEQARKTFAKALHALRRDLGAEDALVGGMTDLRLNSAVISSDVRDFGLALAEGDLERAVKLYAGPFLDAFRLAGAPEFERWADTERAALARDYEHALEKLAESDGARGDHAGAVRWLRKLAAQDPLNARHALSLMRALAEAGDRLGALQHARVYEALVEQELDMPPDREVVALAARLRSEQAAAPHVPAAAPPSQVVTARPTAARAVTAMDNAPLEEAPGGPAAPEAFAASDGAIDTAAAAPPSFTGSRWTPRRLVPWATAVALVVALGLTVRHFGSAASTVPGGVIAVGRISDYRQSATPELARPLGDMLATNLARAPELRVLSTARMYELLSDAEVTRDTSSAAMVAAARRAGASQLVDGALFQIGNDALRLDLRLVDLASGNVIVAHSVTGPDPFALVDSATVLLVAEAGGAAPAGSIADVSTRSMVAYRLYEEGLRAFTRGDFAVADRLLQAALVEDSTFAMAAFYGARTALRVGNWPAVWHRFAVARRFSPRATERERMLIELEFRLQAFSPVVRALADSFVARFPHDVDGYRYVGIVALAQARFADAIANLQRVIEMDSLGPGDARARCVACEAMATLLVVYHAMDSLDAMHREARRWTTLQPKSSLSWRELAATLAMADRGEEALAALRTSAGFSSMPDEPVSEAHFRIRAGSFADADRDLLDAARSTEPERRADMLWMLAISLRHQGRLGAALAVARDFRRVSPSADAVPGAAPTAAIPEAQVLFERGDYTRSAMLFDSIARVTAPPDLESFAAKSRAWFLTHEATARAAQGDTVSLRWLVDSVRVVGARSYVARDQRLHHYVRGLLLAARGRDADAVDELRESIWSPTLGFTRASYEMAKLSLRLGRPREAVAVLQPALRGPIDASNYYVTRTELHELLGWAWLAAGARDSAVAHLRKAVTAWEHADPVFAARRDRARRELERR